ncbi:homoserine dehydrogenase [Vagococcus humatus]|uniref:Homoserine dehydrogenase n=1 Tax=Vagococcus humatus TaxID=1889241 RepID=A0A3R9ZWE5_9ENTE|nr:homoserine dehydrogenase [Vagococcus humatus]RST89346.1 homoserine dehydrogenase [Vagococcus humatus]
MKIAILGYGTVGSGVYELLEQHSHIQVKKIWNRPNPDKQIPLWCEDFKQILLDEDITCVVETLNGIHPAYECITACLKQGKHVVSANKAVIAPYYEYFKQLAQDNQVSFLFEASVAGGIPWIHHLERAKKANTISRCYGILNGTSNFILTKMTQEEKNFEQVLTKAQELGYAEADPSADIDGIDILNKINISASVAFNGKINPEELLTCSMRYISQADISYFKQKGFTLKYLGDIQVKGETYEGSVLLNAVDTHSLEGNVFDQYNLVSLVGSNIGTLKFFGQGAGKKATADAIVQNLLDIQEGKKDQQSLPLNQLQYRPLDSHAYVIKSSKKIPEQWIQAKDSHYYQTTYLTTVQVKELLAYLDDPQAVVVRIMNNLG